MSRTRLFPILLCCFCGLSCGPDKPDDSAVDTDDSSTDDSGDSAAPAYSQSEVEQAYLGARVLPDQLMWAVLTHYAANELGCPQRVELGSNESMLQGDCTNDDGVSYTGTLHVQAESDGSSTFRASAWMVEDPASALPLVGLDGTFTLPAEPSGVATADLTLQAMASTWSSSSSYVFVNFTMNTLQGTFDLWAGEPGTMNATGAMEVLGLDHYTVDVQVSDSGTCESEYDSYSQVLTGTQGTISYAQSSDSCDGCTDWSTEDGSGQICG